MRPGAISIDLPESLDTRMTLDDFHFLKVIVINACRNKVSPTRDWIGIIDPDKLYSIHVVILLGEQGEPHIDEFSEKHLYACIPVCL